MSAPVLAPSPVLDRIVGQPGALATLRSSLAAPVESYLFIGPPGSGKRDAALAFAAALVCPTGGCGTCAACLEALAARHPDVTLVERQGASITVEEARAVGALARRSPAAAQRQVLVLDEFHLVDRAAPALLKTIEEPPPSTVFLVLADVLPPTLVTIASRCLRVEFRRLSEGAIAEALIADGVDPLSATRAAAGAGGRLDRARLLALDEGFAARQARWRAVPERLDGTGATVSVLAAELLAAGEELVAVLRERQAAELAALEAAAERAGERRLSGRAALEDRHRREQRRVRSDELSAGLALLAGAYRARLDASLPRHRAGQLIGGIDAIDEARRSLERNPNELLLLQALLIALDAVG